VVISCEDTGYVSDEEAGKIDYDALMRDMQKSVDDESKRRVQAGQMRFRLLGWARVPYYDAAAKKMYWAKRLQFSDSPRETLNCEIRVLGRSGRGWGFGESGFFQRADCPSDRL